MLKKIPEKTKSKVRREPVYADPMKVDAKDAMDLEKRLDFSLVVSGVLVPD